MTPCSEITVDFIVQCMTCFSESRLLEEDLAALSDENNRLNVDLTELLDERRQLSAQVQDYVSEVRRVEEVLAQKVC